ncbi:MAG: DUF3386 family protein [Rhodopirellula sp. JB055]|uniref:DUF3386 family protein n=1 Tax=Rhodopirellula sp. JB055 TaxID=3342846 RepID=UPI00370C24B4
MKPTHLRIAVAITLLLGGSVSSAEEVLTNTSSATQSAAKDAMASKAMEAAREARAVWHNFPGFTADVTIQTDAVSHAGEILVTDDFDYELSISDEAIHPWVNSKLSSVIGHRRPGGDAPEVTLDERGTSPEFGSYVSRVDGSGVFRIENGRIREVHRKSDSRWFEITNVEFFDSEDGKVLPEITSVTYRDPKTGNITKNKTNRFTWTRVGDFFLPEECLTIETGSDGSRQTREITFTNHRLTTTEPAKKTVVSTSKLHKPLPESLTSFGAAVVGEYLYVFSGHSGDAHGFGKDLLVDHFRRIKFDDPAADWEELAMHESSQSTALVTDGEFIYRIGGLSFINGKDEDGDDQAIFNSTDHFARYDIEADTWTELAPLPSPRSSLDAAIVGRTIYAVGGWDLQGVDGSRDAPWHDTMHAFDLDNPEAGWKELEGPGYQLRAISVGAHDSKLYVLGGISPTGFLRKTSVYDPATNEWTEGPELVGDSQMTGFATSTFAVGGHLYSTGASGVVYRLAEDASEWQVADRLLFPRMFLRLLPAGQDRLIALGGTGGMTGRTAAVETLKVDPSAKVSEKIVSWTVPYDGEAKHSQSLVLDGTKLYAFGGNKSWQPHDFSKEAFSKESFLFDIANQTVAKLADMPHPVQSGAGVVNKQTSEHRTLVVAGGMNFGESTFQSINSLLQYDAKADEWTVAETKLPEPRSMANAVAHDDAIWIFGGSDAGGSHGLSNSVLHWWGDATDIAALPDVSLPHPRRSFGGALVDDEYFLVGGLGDGTSIESSVDVFDMENRTWRTAASPAASRVFPQVAVDGKKIYLFGGFSNTEGHFTECKTLEVYDSETDQWSTLADSIDGVDASMRLFNLAGRLLFFGVDRDNEQQVKFVIYDPNPMTQPKQVAAMSFTGGGPRGSGEAAKNAKMLMRKDTNKDGKLSADELGKRMAVFAEAADTNGDGLVSFTEAKVKMEADEQAEKEANEVEEPTTTDSENDQSESSVSTAQRKADELQRAADAAQREADKAQRAADALRRQS